MIVEDDARRSVGLEHHMIVLAFAGAGGRGVINIVAQLAGLPFGIDAHAARHAQMDHQGLAAVELGQEIFGAPPQGLDLAAREALGEIAAGRACADRPGASRHR